ncbi:DUF4906 domain-containing protein [Parabacteroides sp.]
MKNRKIQQLSLLAGLFSLLFVSCESSIDSTGNDYGKKCDFQFYVKLPESISVETKADNMLGEVNIKNVWILQYSLDNKLLRSVYKEDDINNTEDFVKDGDYMVKINTDTNKDDEKFSDIDSRFYLIVNGGEALFDGTKPGNLTISETDLKAKTVSFNTVLGAIPELLTSGPSEYPDKTLPVSGTETPKKVVFISRLYRPYAKVSLNVQLNDKDASFTGGSNTGGFTTTVTNIPKIMALYTAGGSANGSYYPATIDNNTMTTGATLLNSLAATGTTAWFCIPENLRGTGSSDTFMGKNKIENGPGGTLSGCTYITVKGVYKYNKTHAAGIDVEYRFYLGENLINDYNIQRDHHYNLTLNLKGANSADLRVSITNGNVAVFDKVVTIDNKVEF